MTGAPGSMSPRWLTGTDGPCIVRAPAIQEYLLFLAVSQASPISEADLRRIAREPRWDRQRALFDSLLVRK